MKGLYICNINNQKSPGYRSKIVGQILGFNTLGIEMGLIERLESHIKYTYFERSTFLNHEKLSLKTIFIPQVNLLIYAYQNLLKTQYDFIYLRYPRTDPFLLIFLLIIRIRFRDLKVLSEIPTFPYRHEYFKNTNVKSKIIYFIDFFSRSFLFLFLDRIVSIRYSRKIFNVSTISIGNGVQENQFPLSQPIQKIFDQNPDEIHLLGVANLSFCHGYDRVVRGIAEYQKHKSCYKVYFHIVSPENLEIKALKKLCDSLSLEDKIIFYGTREGEMLDCLFDRCHMAVGSLAAYRKNLKQASALKLREYALRGKLFMNSVEDPDFLDFDYCYVPDNNEDSIKIDEVINFILDKLKIDSVNEIIRQYAKANLSWSKQLQPVVEFLNHSK